MEYRLAKISGVSVGPRPVTNTKSWASESKRLGTPGLDRRYWNSVFWLVGTFVLLSGKASLRHVASDSKKLFLY